MRRLAIALLFAGSVHAAESWVVLEHADEFEGTTSYIAQIQSDRSIETGTPDSAPALLQLRCDKKGAPAYWSIVWPTLLRTSVSATQFAPSMRESSMQLRFDDGKIVGSLTPAGVWPVNPAVGVTQSVYNYATKAILSRALKAQVLRVRDVSWDGRTIDATFALGGLRAAVASLEQNCGRL